MKAPWLILVAMLFSFSSAQAQEFCPVTNSGRIDLSAAYPDQETLNHRHILIQRTFGAYSNRFLNCQRRFGALGGGTAFLFTVLADGQMQLEQIVESSETSRCYAEIINRFAFVSNRCGTSMAYSWNGQFPLQHRH